MENPETPKRRGWSIVRKAQIITGVIGAFVTIIGMIPFPFLDNLSPHGAASNFRFDVVMYLVTPTAIIADLLGVDQGLLSGWIGLFTVVIVNTLLCIIIGTFAGLICAIGGLGRIHFKNGKNVR